MSFSQIARKIETGNKPFIDISFVRRGGSFKEAILERDDFDTLQLSMVCNVNSAKKMFFCILSLHFLSSAGCKILSKDCLRAYKQT